MAKGSVRAISGVGGKGPACFLVEAGGVRLLLDLGQGPEPGIFPPLEDLGPVDAILLSHAHPDHAGGLKRCWGMVGTPPIWATAIERRLLPAAFGIHELPLQGSLEIAGIRVTTGRSGHAAGGVWLHLDVGGGVLYLGDHSAESLLFAFDPPPPSRVVILDASYGIDDVTMAQQMRAFDALFALDAILLPVPTHGRATEIALHLHRQGARMPALCPDALAAFDLVRSTDRPCLRDGVGAELDSLADELRGMPTAEPGLEPGGLGVMLAGRPNANGGLVAALLPLWGERNDPPIVFTSFVPKGTPAHRLVESGRASTLRWNAHPPLSENVALAREVGARIVIPAFGPEHFRPAWVEAFAPAEIILQETIVLD